VTVDRRRVRLTTFARDELRFEVSDTGPLDAADVVVCLHGFPQDRTAFDEVAAQLAAAGLRVLVPNQRGYSPQARPHGRAAYALELLADDVVTLLNAAGVDRAHVVGHDWGGGVAWFVGSRRAHRVVSLTVLSTAHPAAMRAQLWRGGQALRSWYVAAFQLPWLPEAGLTAAHGRLLESALRGSGLPADRAGRYVQRMCQPGALTAALGWYRAIPAPQGRGAGRVSVPTTYVVGRRDPFFSPASVRATAELVTGPYQLVGLDAGHWLPELEPDTVAQLVHVQAAAVRRPR
jgi:pimeloyl-ACP methyl ester carboxylesterase